MTKSTFAFVDSNFTISQHLQMLAIRHYANSTGLDVTFYGVEVAGCEQGHLLLNNYIINRDESIFLFFSIRQFINEDHLIETYLLKNILCHKKEIHFANESLKISNIESLSDLIILTYSQSFDSFDYL